MDFDQTWYILNP